MGKPAGMATTEFHRIRHLAAIKAWDKRGRKNRAGGGGAGGGGAGGGGAPGDWRFRNDPGAGPHVGSRVVGGVVRPGGGPVQARGDWKASKWAEKESRMSTTPAKEIKSNAERTDRGVSESYEIRLEDGTHGNFKPSSGELEGCRDGIEKGQMAERELAAWEIAKVVGMDDMVAPVVIREFDVPGGGEDPNGVPYLAGRKRGSFAEWQEGKLARHVEPKSDAWDGETDAIRAAIYDFVIGNQDRHGKNWVIAADGKMKLIDHGLAFGEEKLDPCGNMMLMAHATRDIGGKPPKDEIDKYVKNKSAILEVLKRQGLPKAAIQRVGERIDSMVGATDYSFFDRHIKEQDPFAMLLRMLQ